MNLSSRARSTSLRLLGAVATLSALMALTACGSDEDAQSARQPTLTEYVAALETVDSHSSTLTDVEKSDGARDTVVLHDKNVKCPLPGIECGVVVDVWGSNDEATFESEQLLALQRGMQDVLGWERHIVAGSTVLRVNLDLPEPVVEAYLSAFKKA